VKYPPGFDRYDADFQNAASTLLELNWQTALADAVPVVVTATTDEAAEV
jgi:hypothetical protein